MASYKNIFRLLFVPLALAFLGLVFISTIPAYADDPTETPTATATETATPTATATATATGTATPTATATFYYHWAQSAVNPSSGLVFAVEDLLKNDTPEEATTDVYAFTFAQSDVGNWILSIANLDGVSAPYDEWNIEENAIWTGSVYCTDDSPWVCVYYQIVQPEGGGDSALVFPWQVGTRAEYGIAGVHAGYSNPAISYAVDFVGSSEWGGNVMPNMVYAAASGVVEAICMGTINQAVKITGDLGSYMYVHINPATPITIGESFPQGSQIGQLVYGSFSDNCGRATQNNNTYHIHFGFNQSILNIGNCTIDVTDRQTAKFTCPSGVIAPGGMLNNYQSSTIDDGSGTAPDSPDQAYTAAGGDNLTSQIILGIDSFLDKVILPIFPDHTDMYLNTYFTNGTEPAFRVAYVLSQSGLILLSPFFTCLMTIVLLEAVRAVVSIWRWLLKVFPAAN